MNSTREREGGGRHYSLCRSDTGRHPYEASDDGERFLFSIPAQTGSDSINVVLNWTKELKELVPVPWITAKMVLKS